MRRQIYFYNDEIPHGPFLADLLPEPDGSFLAMVHEVKKETWLNAKEASEFLTSKGVPISWKSIYRLADDQLIQDSYPLPHTRVFSKTSLESYIVMIRNDPEFFKRKGSPGSREQRARANASRGNRRCKTSAKT